MYWLWNMRKAMSYGKHRNELINKARNRSLKGVTDMEFLLNRNGAFGWFLVLKFQKADIALPIRQSSTHSFPDFGRYFLLNSFPPDTL